MDEQKEKSICPLCGATEYTRPELDEDIKDDYLESILGEVPFTRTYDLMDGKIEVTVSGLSDEATNLKAKLYVKVFKLAETTPDIKSYIPQLEQMTDLDCQLCGITVHTKKAEHPIEMTRELCSGVKAALELDWSVTNVQQGFDLIHKVIDVVTNSVFPGTTISKPMLRGVVGKHNMLLADLIRECLDANFLSGTGR